MKLETDVSNLPTTQKSIVSFEMNEICNGVPEVMRSTRRMTSLSATWQAGTCCIKSLSLLPFSKSHLRRPDGKDVLTHDILAKA